MAAAELKPELNKWDLVFDFTETDDAGNKIDNFHTLDPSKFSIVNLPIEGFDAPASQLPLPKKFGGELEDNDPTMMGSHGLDGMSEFKLGTSAAEA